MRPLRKIRGKDVLQLVKIFQSRAAGLTDRVSDLKWMKYMKSKSNRAAKVECIRVGLGRRWRIHK